MVKPPNHNRVGWQNINKIIHMRKNLTFFVSSAQTEYSIDLHTLTMGTSDSEVMFITVTTIDEDGRDYTVVFNGLPYGSGSTKLLKKAFGNDANAAKFFLDALKENAVEEACKYWGFDKDEWVINLDAGLKPFIKGISRKK